jgi:hypothetical protein
LAIDIPPSLHSTECIQFRVEKNEIYTTPFTTVTPPNYTESMTMTDGVKIYGPVIFILCGSKLTITKP